jgi:hypothetical protein
MNRRVGNLVNGTMEANEGREINKKITIVMNSNESKRKK